MFLSKKSYTLEEATKKLEHYCAYQERCHQEVVKKLEGMQMIPEVIDVILVHLITHNFLNEERYAKTFVSGKLRIKYWGRRRLTFELQKKDISKFNINTALKSIDEEEYMEIFNSLAQKKADSIRETNKYKKRKKLIDYLLYRGWESHLVYDKANELIT
ncbi:RecX family transcriptional regulator [Oceanihabitans sp. IOP_32]|uniref:regulatory protein RecX n=1 Tax=Oceanihabitans sp. IOP_32 TaxID=2529032 RepID=UPI001293E890|nr:regulatory protein RecX [Oceanihabitans sp. IOP_32]QFZ54298.1 RecX family transcriptional regulator [Oceanihabitans sp. IOP_32]